MSSSHNQEQIPEIVKLTPPPKISKEDLVGITFGIRPYRKGGIRLESEKIANKTIYHNYGHGGGGVSLGYGCCKVITDKFLCEKGSQTKEIAIIGSGYMGLFESIILADLGFKVTVYADSFPIKFGAYDQKAKTLPITSQVAGGLWLPYGYDTQNQPLHNSCAIETYNFYKQGILNKTYKGLSFKNYYMLDIEDPIVKHVPKTLFQTKKIKIDFGNGKLHDALTCQTILIDGDKFLNELIQEAKSKNVNFIQKHFNSIQDVKELKQEVIFNCTGNGSHKLFGDNNFTPIAGHLIYIPKQSGIDYFMASVTEDKKEKVTLYPHGNKLAVGLTSHELGWIKEPQEKCIQQLINNLNDFISRKADSIKPKL